MKARHEQKWRGPRSLILSPAYLCKGDKDILLGCLTLPNDPSCACGGQTRRDIEQIELTVAWCLLNRANSAPQLRPLYAV